MTPDRANIALTGFMAAGKTVVGRSLARSLGWVFVDLDAVVEADQGASVRELFTRRGEAWFRKREKAALGQTLTGRGRIIALGGGAVLDPDNRSLLRERSLLVWLRATPETVLRRIRGNEDRPLLQAGPAPSGAAPGTGAGRTSDATSDAVKLRRIEELSAQRCSFYAEAHLAVDTDGLTVEQVARRIRRQLCRP